MLPYSLSSPCYSSCAPGVGTRTTRTEIVISRPSPDELFELFLADAEQPFEGWDFAHIGGSKRMTTAPLTWSYTSTLLPMLRRVGSMLDMGTGGGEYLTRLQPLPPHTCATEGHPPNVPIARQRLEPLGVTVREIDGDSDLPFADGQLDLIANRHESYDPAELRRLLKPGGWFVTQQVGGGNDQDLNRLLGGPENPEFAHWTLGYAVNELTKAGLRIVERREAFPTTHFFDIGAIVYYLKAAPWQMPDFSVDHYRDQLYRLHERILEEGFIAVESQRFLIVATRDETEG